MIGCKQRKLRKLEARRTKVLSAIRGEQLAFETMVQRAQVAGETPDNTFVQGVLTRIMGYEQAAKQETDIDELENFIDDAERQGQLRAYICPIAEISDQGSLSIDRMEEWKVPKAVIAKLRNSLGKKLENGSMNPSSARSALRAIFEECDSWLSYTDDYEEEMQKLTRRLFISTIVMLPMSLLLFNFQSTFIGGLLFSGATGSCVSVMAKMPVLEVALSGELESYGRRILSRVGIGIIASLIGCAFLGWGLLPIAIQGQTFAEVLNACSAHQTAPCPSLATLILLGVPMLFGFSERALASFEQQVLSEKS